MVQLETIFVNEINNVNAATNGYYVEKCKQIHELEKNIKMVVEDLQNKGKKIAFIFPRYIAGKSGNKGSKGCGVLEQYGSQKLATEGYTYRQILNYYYSGSDYSSGDVSLFGYNIGY